MHWLAHTGAIHGEKHLQNVKRISCSAAQSCIKVRRHLLAKKGGATARLTLMTINYNTPSIYSTRTLLITHCNTADERNRHRLTCMYINCGLKINWRFTAQNYAIINVVHIWNFSFFHLNMLILMWLIDGVNRDWPVHRSLHWSRP